MKLKLKFQALILIVILALLTTSGCKGEQAPGGSGTGDGEAGKDSLSITAEYFPTDAGLYKKFTDAEGGWEETILESTEFEGKQSIPVLISRLEAHKEDQVEEIDLQNYTNFYRVTEKEVQLIGMESELSPGEIFSDAVNPPWIMMTFNTQKGNEWAYEMINPPGTVKVEVEGFEDLSTPAGKFKNAVKLKLDSEYINQAGETEQATHYEWYAPKVGLVKVKGDNQAKDAELVAFKEAE